ncbi:hypothetical protein [Streptomyces sp. NPDC005907]|uniref:hypothetical protein n=1 Tax=Streptomyces sp. NPDC005907 TaxID=3154571 RepID=UPI0033D877AC
MIILTGPQSTDEEIGLLFEMAGLFGAHLTLSRTVEWAAVTALYCLTGWEKSPQAVADVGLANAFGLAIRHVDV